MGEGIVWVVVYLFRGGGGEVCSTCVCGCFGESASWGLGLQGVGVGLRDMEMDGR